MAAAGLQGVLLGGNYVAGVALGKCVEHGYEFAEEIAQYVAAQKCAPKAAAAKAPVGAAQ